MSRLLGMTEFCAKPVAGSFTWDNRASILDVFDSIKGVLSEDDYVLEYATTNEMDGYKESGCQLYEFDPVCEEWGSVAFRVPGKYRTYIWRSSNPNRCWCYISEWKSNILLVMFVRSSSANRAEVIDLHG